MVFQILQLPEADLKRIRDLKICAHNTSLQPGMPYSHYAKTVKYHYSP